MFEMTAVKISHHQVMGKTRCGTAKQHASYTHTKQQQKQLTSDVGLEVGDTDGLLLGLFEGDFDGL